jgi:hypothetical protein
MSLAVPVVRLCRKNRALDVQVHFDYINKDISDPYFPGEVRMTDALEEHELAFRDLIEDDGFVEATLVDGEQILTAALLWFEKLERNWLAGQQQEAEEAQHRAQAEDDYLAGEAV